MSNNHDSFLKLTPLIQEALIREYPHTRFTNTPPEFNYLTGGIVDLGLENMGLNERQFKLVMLAYRTIGLRIPGTNYKIIGSFLDGAQIIRAGQEDIIELPVDWQESLYITNPDTNEIIYAGSKVRQDQLL